MRSGRPWTRRSGLVGRRSPIDRSPCVCARASSLFCAESDVTPSYVQHARRAVWTNVGDVAAERLRLRWCGEQPNTDRTVSSCFCQVSTTRLQQSTQICGDGTEIAPFKPDRSACGGGIHYTHIYRRGWPPPRADWAPRKRPCESYQGPHLRRTAAADVPTTGVCHSASSCTLSGAWEST